LEFNGGRLGLNGRRMIDFNGRGGIGKKANGRKQIEIWNRKGRGIVYFYPIGNNYFLLLEPVI